MKNQEQKMKLPKLDDLFTNQEQRDYDNAEKVEMISIDLIDDNPNNPYHVNKDDKLQDMAESIKQYGVLEPIIIRPKENGRYELIAGHRRKIASILIDCMPGLGMITINALACSWIKTRI